MLHFDGEVVRTVTFRETGDSYRWVREQEVHQGPHSYSNVNGEHVESISITHQIERMDGGPIGKTYVSYWGEDPRLAARRGDLTLEDVQPVLLEWRALRSRGAS
jgi:hypothetical protein